MGGEKCGGTSSMLGGGMLLCSRYFGGAQIREGEKEGKRERGDEMAGGGWGWRRVVVVEAVDGCLICERVRVERSRQEENKTHRGSRAEQSRAKQCRPADESRAEASRERLAGVPQRHLSYQEEGSAARKSDRSAGGSRAEPNRAEPNLRRRIRPSIRTS